MTRTRFADADIIEGAPATLYSGPSNYAAVVVSVERFKSGTRKGQVKAIETSSVDTEGRPTWRLIRKYLAYISPNCDQHTEPSIYCGTCKTAGSLYFAQNAKRYSTLIVGHADTYYAPEQ